MGWDRHTWIVLVVVVLAVLGLAVAERVSPGTGQRALEYAVMGPERGVSLSYNISISYDAETGQWRGGEQTWESTLMAKTQVAEYEVVTCTVQIYGIVPAQTSALGHPATLIQVTGGPGFVQFNANGVTTIDNVVHYIFHVEIDPAEPETRFGIIYVPADGALHDYAVSIQYPAVLNTTHADDPIAPKSGTTHAKECAATEFWTLPTSGNWSATALGVTIEWPWAGAITRGFGIASLIDVDSAGSPHFEDEMDFFRVANIAVNTANIDASRCNVEFLPWHTGGSNTPENVWARGAASTIRIMQDDYVGTSGTTVGLSASPPRVYVGCPPVNDMDGNLRGTLEVTAPAIQIYDDDLSAWVAVTMTVEEWQSYTATPDWGPYSWDESPPPDGALRVLAGYYAYITKETGQEQGDDGYDLEGAVSGRSFEHDARLIIQAWELRKTSRQVSPFADDIITVAHVSSVGLYKDALTPDSWVGTGGVGSPDAEGNFRVGES